MQRTLRRLLPFLAWMLIFDSCHGLMMRLKKKDNVAPVRTSFTHSFSPNAATMNDASKGDDSPSSSSLPPLPPGRSTRRLSRFFCDDTIKLLNPKTMGSYQWNRMKDFGSPIFKTNIFFTPTVFVVDESYVQKLGDLESIKTLQAFFPPHHQQLFGRNALIVQSGPTHGRLRRLLQPSLSPMVMKSYEPIVTDYVQNFFRKELPTTKNGYQDFRPMVPLMRSFFISLTLRVVLGAGNIPIDVPALAKDLEIWSNGLLAAPLTFIPWSAASKALRARKRIVQEFNRWMDQDDPGTGLLAKMIAARDDGADSANPNNQDSNGSNSNGNMLTRDEIIDNILTVIFAGSDTTASAAISIWKILSLNPSLKAKLRTASTSGDVETIDRFVEMVLESFPPAPFSMRLNTQDLSVGPYRIPANWLVVYGFAGTLRSKSVDRDWLKDLDDPKSNPSKSLAFGGGPRKCPGRFLACMELKTIVKELVGYSWKLKEDQNLDQAYNPGFFPKDGLLIKV